MVTLADTLEDELPVQPIDLDATIEAKACFDFETYRRPECYRLITEHRPAGAGAERWARPTAGCRLWRWTGFLVSPSLPR